MLPNSVVGGIVVMSTVWDDETALAVVDSTVVLAGMSASF